MIVLNLRNGMALLNITGHIQTGVIGVLLIVSVVAPRLDLAWLLGRSRGSAGEGAGP
jgi:rhamnose transport system permease protein